MNSRVGVRMEVRKGEHCAGSMGLDWRVCRKRESQGYGRAVMTGE
jgi:hypothetical protein